MISRDAHRFHDPARGAPAEPGAGDTIDLVGRSDTGTPARLPDEQGVVERDGVRIHWESYGDGSPAILLLPTWSILHSRHWKGQIAYLARHFRVVTFDGRGNGLSDRPPEPEDYNLAEFVEDAVAVLDTAGLESACMAGVSMGAVLALQLASRHPERVDGALLIGPSVPALTPPWADRPSYSFNDEPDTDEGWAKYTRSYWLRDYRGFLEFFFGQVFPEPHSTKQIEDSVAFGLDTTTETLISTQLGSWGVPDREAAEVLCRSVRCPVLVIQGSEDRLVPPGRGERVAELTGGELVRFGGSGHAAQARQPVQVNLLLRELVERVAGTPPPARTWTRSLARPKRALLVSSPIGLGHAWRDVAIADELRRQVPGLEIHWLAQEPVTTVLRERGERFIRRAGSSRARRRTSTARRASTTFMPSRRSGGWTRSSVPTSCSSTTSSASSSTTSGSGTRPGSSTISCTRTRS